MAFDGKVEYPWSEAKTKQVPELVVFEIGDKLVFQSVIIPSTVDGKGFQYLPCQPY